MIITRIIVLVAVFFAGSGPLHAHHVLGRPAYSLNEDSNTPPSMQLEIQIGDYFVSTMVYPAFPKPGERGRINLYAAGIDSGEVYDGKVTFTVRDDTWFGRGVEERIGIQSIDDSVYRQGFIFSEEGDYIVTARFEAGGEPYVIDFPLRIGAPGSGAPLGLAVAVIVIVLVVVNVIQRKRLLRVKIRKAHEETSA